MQTFRHSSHRTAGEEKVWQSDKKHHLNGNEPTVSINNIDDEKLWCSESIKSVKVFNETVLTTSTTINSNNTKYDGMTSLAASPTPSYAEQQNSVKLQVNTINQNNLIKSIECDKLIT